MLRIYLALSYVIVEGAVTNAKDTSQLLFDQLQLPHSTFDVPIKTFEDVRE